MGHMPYFVDVSANKMSLALLERMHMLHPCCDNISASVVKATGPTHIRDGILAKACFHDTCGQWDSCDVLEVDIDGPFGSGWGKGSGSVAMGVEGCAGVGMSDTCVEADGLCERERGTRLRPVCRRDQRAQK
jgi:hypothetical protein